MSDFCTGCLKRTTWTPGRSGRERCQGCKTEFPCDRKCPHADCQEARGEIAADKDGFLRRLKVPTKHVILEPETPHEETTRAREVRPQAEPERPVLVGGADPEGHET